MKRSTKPLKDTNRLPSQPINQFSQTHKEKWPNDVVHRYVGNFISSYFAYAADETIRENAASGGVVTSLLTYLLINGTIDGALVCRSSIVDGNVVPEFIIAQNKRTLLSCQGSIYSAVEFTRDALPLIRKFSGKLAVCVLPCDAQKLDRLRKNDPEIRKKVVLILALFCGHNSRPELTKMILNKLDRQEVGIKNFRYRKGHWRGQLEVVLNSDKKIRKPFSYFSDYQNLFFFSQQKCHYCHDHMGYSADISVGDIWSQRMKDLPIKHSAVITRTDAGKVFFQEAVEKELIVSSKEQISEICEGQSRSLPFHFNVSARSRAGKLVGVDIKDEVYERVRWNDYLTAWIALSNEKVTRTEKGRRFVALLPRIVVKLYLYLFKGLESF